MALATAALVIVGDEILSGHTQDTNSHWVAQRLRHRGVRLLRIETVPDVEDEIETAVRRILLRDAPTFLFVVGGIGPTPDDRTYAAVAKALDATLEARATDIEELSDRLRRRGLEGVDLADVQAAEAYVRMVRVPKGAQRLKNPVGLALGCVADWGASKVVVLSGVPRELHAMYESSFEPVHLANVSSTEEVRELAVTGEEARLWDILNRVERDHPGVRVGSYPQGDRRIILRLTGPTPLVHRAHDQLVEWMRTYGAS